jgi:hypothetical protein
MLTLKALGVIPLAIMLWGPSAPHQSTAKKAHFPNLIRAELPLYPPIARTAHITGTVEIEVVVEKGAVVDAQVKSVDIQIEDPTNRITYDDRARSKARAYLSVPSIANVKTWQFQSAERTTLLVRYVYGIEGEPTPLPENPEIEIHLPVVKITARPFKPTCSDCVSQ